ncbi:MAG: hypothetical protein ABJR35_04370, partial [Roseibium sp.]
MTGGGAHRQASPAKDILRAGDRGLSGAPDRFPFAPAANSETLLGFVRSLFQLMKLELAVPDFTTLSRRAGGLAPLPRARSEAPVSLDLFTWRKTRPAGANGSVPS